MERLRKASKVLMGIAIGFLLGWIILIGSGNLKEVWNGFLDALI